MRLIPPPPLLTDVSSCQSEGWTIPSQKLLESARAVLGETSSHLLMKIVSDVCQLHEIGERRTRTSRTRWSILNITDFIYRIIHTDSRNSSWQSSRSSC
eukprot:747112-Hanusia_phi.AAC.2